MRRTNLNKRTYSEEDIKKVTDAFILIHQQILEIYESNNGEPDRNPIECPMCKKEQLQYACNWYGNKHIRAYCNNCNWNVMQ